MRSSTKVKPINLSVVLEWGGLGDQICRLPAIKKMVSNPHVFIKLHCPSYFLDFAKEMLKDIPQIEFLTLSDPKLPFGMDFNPDKLSSLAIHLVHHAYMFLLGELPDDASYLKAPLGPRVQEGDYVIITTGFTAKVREWDPSSVNAVVNWCLDNQYIPIFLGSKEIKHNDVENINATFSNEIQWDQGKDLRGQTSLMEALHLMQYAKAVVGVDNGLLHLAGMTDVPIIAGYTSVLAKHRMPIRNNIIGYNVTTVEPDNCYGCQSLIKFDFNHDFRICYHGDYTCTKELTSNKWIRALEFVLKGTHA